MAPTDITAQSASLIAALRHAACYPHTVDSIEVLETHISWVVLTGRYAYKIKKPVNLGFLDFTTLEARHHYCEEELRLNRRFAPSLYEAVVPISGAMDNPRMGADGPILEYAVKMRQFPQSALANRLLDAGALTVTHIDALAACIAAFHTNTGAADCDSGYGSPESVAAPARDNFTVLSKLYPEVADQENITALRVWSDQEHQTHESCFAARQMQSRVRECHGDLHLGNIVMLDGQLTPFDGIEFDPALRWIDVMSEVAFLVMDLFDHARMDFAIRFLNAYLELSGDYAGLKVLRFYLVYRAMVRAKVHALRAAQVGTEAAERDRLFSASRSYIELARGFTHRNYGEHPPIILMHGLSGSGKTMIAKALAEFTGGIHLRSDVERKRLMGLAPLVRSSSALAAGIYGAELTHATYQRLLEVARLATRAGYAVIVDATFLQTRQRDLFRHEASAQRSPFIIVDVTAPESILRARIDARLTSGHDASEANQAVLTHQLANREPLTREELPAVLRVDTSRSDAQGTLIAAGAALRAHLAACMPVTILARSLT